MEETVYVGRINPIFLEINHDGTPANFSDATKMAIYFDGSVIYSDSTYDPAAVEWDVTGNVTLTLGLTGISTGVHQAMLEVYYINRKGGFVELDDLLLNVKSLIFNPVGYYCDVEDIKRFYGLVDRRIKIGNSDDDQISLQEVDKLIVDVEKFINGKVKRILGVENVPFDATNVPEEINFVATRLTAYFLYRIKYLGQMPEEADPVNQWRREALDVLEDFTSNVRAGVYTDFTYTPATTMYSAKPLAVSLEEYFFPLICPVDELEILEVEI